MLSPGLPREFSGSNQEATKQVGEPSHAGNAGGHSVWFSWTPDVSGPVAINGGCFPGFDMLTAVEHGVGGQRPDAGRQQRGPSGTVVLRRKPQGRIQRRRRHHLLDRDRRPRRRPGVLQRHDRRDAGQRRLRRRDRDRRRTVPTGFRHDQVRDPQASEPDHAGEPASHSVWFTWTPDVGGPVAISTCSSFYSLDTVLAVYTGSAVDSLTPVVANDDAPATEGFPGCAGANSEVRFAAAVGTSYKIAVDSTGGTVGRFTLRLHGRPKNDDFDSPEVLPAALNPNFPIGASQMTTDMATKQGGEPSTLVLPVVSPSGFRGPPLPPGRSSLSTCTHEPAGDPDTLLAVYTGEPSAL